MRRRLLYRLRPPQKNEINGGLYSLCLKALKYNREKIPERFVNFVSILVQNPLYADTSRIIINDDTDAFSGPDTQSHDV